MSTPGSGGDMTNLFSLITPWLSCISLLGISSECSENVCSEKFISALAWISSLYTCEGEIFLSSHSEDLAPYFVKEVSHNHIENKRNKDVKALLIENSEFFSMLENIPHFFPDLQSLSAINCGIKELKSEDFEDLPNLLQIDFRSNKIQQLPMNVFEEVPNLQVIGLSLNPIKYIAHQVFDHLTDLETLDMFGTNRCYNKKLEHNKTAIASELYDIYRQCPPTFEMLKMQLGWHVIVQKLEKCETKLDEAFSNLMYCETVDKHHQPANDKPECFASLLANLAFYP
ncbi:CLUMA_CG009765, isoform A [Clunio marinus]|uniref:CLUMA_CG009765, isoform A n=1 Tax=Clunio marinus TaxID=568069 RepID=A0A1J1I826_9DIPT|nr:CLUMA_CG009765, isoform A [Clunio marinus]